MFSFLIGSAIFSSGPGSHSDGKTESGKAEAQLELALIVAW